MELQFDPQKLDFGEVIPGSIVSLPVKIINKTNKGITFDSCKFNNNDKKYFSTQIDFPFEVPKSGAGDKQIIITLNAPINYFDEVISEFVFTDDDLNDSIKLPLRFKVKKDDPPPFNITVSIPNISVKVGDKFNIPVHIDKVDGNAGGNKFSITLTFNSTICAFQNPSEIGIIQFGKQTKTFYGNLTKHFENGDNFILPDMIATLGDAISTDIHIIDFSVFNNSEKLKFNPEFKDGNLTISNIEMINNKPRLVTSITNNLNISVIENGKNSDIKVKVKYLGNTRLETYDIMGKPIDLSNLLTNHNSLSEEIITIPRNTFTTIGTYFLRLSSVQESISELIIVK